MRSVSEDVRNCPCLMPPLAHRDGDLPLAVYCRPGPRRVHVPSRDELAGLCTGGAYVECAGYQRWMAAAAWEEV